MRSPDFAKVFVSILDSTIANNWRARHLFEDLLKLADWQGHVDMTPEAIARRTGWPHGLDALREDLSILNAPDLESRTPDEEGRRIVLLEEGRAWGWRVVNIEAYRNAGDTDRLRELARERKRRQRAKERGENVETEKRTETALESTNGNEEVSTHVLDPDFTAAGLLCAKIEASGLRVPPPLQLVIAWVGKFGAELVTETIEDCNGQLSGKHFNYLAEILATRLEDPTQRPGKRRKGKQVATQVVDQQRHEYETVDALRESIRGMLSDVASAERHGEPWPLMEISSEEWPEYLAWLDGEARGSVSQWRGTLSHA